MIRIGKPCLSQHNQWTRITSELEIDGQKKELWFETTHEWASFLCADRVDAWVLALFQYAMRYRHDIVCEAPMTDRLYDGFCRQFLSAFYRANPDAYPVKITATTIPEVEVEGVGAVGTGVSCGVDSMHVFAKHPEITHGCIWNGHGVTYQETEESRVGAWADIQSRAADFTKAVGVKLVIGNTNYDRGCLPDLAWDGGTTQGNLFCIFCLQKLWSVYYIASDCDISNFKFKISLREDPAHYEFFLFPFLTLKHMVVRMDGTDCNRVEKTRDIVLYHPSRKFLNVCWGITSGHKNCSCYCPKCMRTMLCLWLLGALDEFSDLFDVKYFHDNLHQYLAEHYRGLLQHDFFQEEMRDMVRQKDIPLSIRLAAWGIVVKKSMRKLLRGGRRSHHFLPE